VFLISAIGLYKNAIICLEMSTNKRIRSQTLPIFGAP
jgi:hypothetical protein